MEHIAEDWEFCDDVDKNPLSNWYSTKTTRIPYDISPFFETQRGGKFALSVDAYQTGITIAGNTVTILAPSARSPESQISIAHLQRLQHRSLTDPLEIIIEQDEGGFIARTTDLPLYGYGEDRIEAIEMLKREIESLYEDLTEDDNFSDEWIEIKRFLERRIINPEFTNDI